MKGTLKIRLISADFLHDQDIIGKMDPYAILEVGSQKQQSAMKNGMGTKPVWNQDFVFKVDGESQLKISFFDDDIGTDDYLGEIVLGLEQFGNGIPVESSYSIYGKDKKAPLGQLRIKIDFDPLFNPSLNNNQYQKSGPWGS